MDGATRDEIGPHHTWSGQGALLAVTPGQRPGTLVGAAASTATCAGTPAAHCHAQKPRGKRDCKLNRRSQTLKEL